VWLARGAGKAGMEVPATCSTGAGGEGGGGTKINQELWYACAGPLVALPPAGSLVVYFPRATASRLLSRFLSLPLQRFLIKVVDSPYSRSAKLLFQFRSFCSCDFFCRSSSCRFPLVMTPLGLD
jgi:hypothetical protein